MVQVQYSHHSPHWVVEEVVEMVQMYIMGCQVVLVVVERKAVVVLLEHPDKVMRVEVVQVLWLVVAEVAQVLQVVMVQVALEVRVEMAQHHLYQEHQ